MRVASARLSPAPCAPRNYRGFRLYDLRHTFASLLLAQGAPITYVSAQLGHTDATTTLRWYARWLPRVDRRAVDLLDDVLIDAHGAAQAGTVGSQSTP